MLGNAGPMHRLDTLGYLTSLSEADLTSMCCGYSNLKVRKSRGLLILLKLSLVSDEGVYIIVARPKSYLLRSNIHR